MSKFRVAFDLDISQIAPEAMRNNEADPRLVEQVITKLFINEARVHAKEELHRIRRDPDLDADVKTIRMAEQVRKMMLTLMVQANLEVTALSSDATISTKLPFEQAYQEVA